MALNKTPNHVQPNNYITLQLHFDYDDKAFFAEDNMELIF